jgi:hypothetical protein
VAKGDLRGTLTGSVNSVTNPTVASGSVAVSVGDLVFGTMSQQTALSASGTVTDNLGNTYAYVNAGTDGGTVAGRSFYARVTVAGTLTTVNVPATASANDASVVADVIEGPFLTSPLDASLANATDATTPFTCTATGVMAQASNVVMAAISIAANQTVAATSPSTICGTVARANASVGQSRRVVSATTSVAPEFTGTSATAVQTTAAFKLDPTSALTPALFTNSQTFHEPTVTPGAVGVTPDLFTNSQTFHAPTVLSTYPLTPDLFANSQTFFEPTVASDGPGSQDLTPSLFTNTQTFHAATVGAGAVDLTPSLFTNAQTFHGPTVAPGAVDLTPSLFSNAQTFFAPTVVGEGGEQDLTPDLFVNEQIFYSPTVEGVVVAPPVGGGGTGAGGSFSRSQWKKLRDLKAAIQDAEEYAAELAPRSQIKVAKAAQAAAAVAEAVAQHAKLAEVAKLNAITNALDAATGAKTIAATIRHADEAKALADRALAAVIAKAQAEADEEEEAIALLLLLT